MTRSTYLGYGIHTYIMIRAWEEGQTLQWLLRGRGAYTYNTDREGTKNLHIKKDLDCDEFRTCGDDRRKPMYFITWSKTYKRMGLNVSEPKDAVNNTLVMVSRFGTIL